MGFIDEHLADGITIRLFSRYSTTRSAAMPNKRESSELCWVSVLRMEVRLRSETALLSATMNLRNKYVVEGYPVCWCGANGGVGRG
jgi:hypothetical protein